MKRALVILLALTVGLYALAAPPQGLPLRFPPESGTCRVLIFRAIDGDTVRFTWLIEDSARLYGINAPELKGDTRPAGQAAKKHLESLLSREMTAEVMGREKYGRTLLKLWTDDRREVGQVMIQDGQAKPYNP